MRVRVSLYEAVRTAEHVFVRAHSLRYLTDPLLHLKAFPCSLFLSGERGNDTFVASNKLCSSSHAVSTGSGTGMGGRCFGGEGGG